MADLFVRTYTFVDGTTAYGSQVEAEVGNIVTVLNNLNTAATNWGRVSISHATLVPLVADCAAGTQNIANFNNNSAIKASIDSTGILTLVPTANQIVLGTTRTVTITAPTPASASRIVTIPDLSAAYSVVGTEGTQTINGTKTLSGTIDVTGQLKGKGTASNTVAASGYIGEYLSNSATATASTGSGQLFDVTSLVLPAGDYLVGFNCTPTATAGNPAACTTWAIGISVTSGNSATGLTFGSNYMSALPAFDGHLYNEGRSLYGYHVSTTGTTVYGKCQISFSSGTWASGGLLFAIRIS